VNQRIGGGAIKNEIMNYEDRLYGKTKIDEPVILELINCPTLQRLKGIDQAGYYEPYFPGKSYTRFEHSVGVFLLLKLYNASIEEQVAGLIHDVSHSAFSHCIDYTMDAEAEKEHSHQDNIFDDYVKKSEIPEIIKKYNLDLDFILDDKNFPLKEKDLPDLCADRIDYSLRTATMFNYINIDQRFFDDLTVKNGQWIFKNFANAKKYAELFLTLNRDYYAGIFSAVMNKTVGDYLKHALTKGYVTEADLYTTDEVVLTKIAPHLKTDQTLNALFERMNNKIKFKNDPTNYDILVFCKSRVVDPLFWDGDKVKRISEAEPSWVEIIQQELKPKEYFIKFDK